MFASAAKKTEENKTEAKSEVNGTAPTNKADKKPQKVGLTPLYLFVVRKFS